MLAPGTIEGLLDNVDRTLSLSAYTDQDIYDLEMEAIFAKAWIAVAHETEIPQPGDFVTRCIGEDPVIVARGTDGKVNVLLNTCSHRGMGVCRAEMGNGRSFRCAYHGWTYDLQGDLQGAPLHRSMYGDDFDKSKLGLLKARVGTYAGMIFATWDEGAPTLEEYLGPLTWYLDAAFHRTPGELEVLGSPQRWIVHSNWKLIPDQFSGDAYHALTLHRSMQEVGLFPEGADLPSEGMYGVNVTMNGHGIRCLDIARLALPGVFEGKSAIEVLSENPPPGMTSALAAEMGTRLSEEQLAMMAKYPPVLGTVFPNLVWLNIGMPSPDRRPSAVIAWKLIQPKGPHDCEIFSWALVEKDAPEEVRELTRRTTILTFSDSGVFEVDDAEAWGGIQKAVRGVKGRQRRANFQASAKPEAPPGWAGGGSVYGGFSKDDNQWAFYQRWQQFLLGKVW